MSTLTVIWIFAAVILAVLEALTLGLVSIWFCIGSIAAAITSAFTQSLFIQSAVFVIVSGITLAITRPLVKKFITKDFTPTNVDRIIGTDAVVLTEIDPIENKGTVKANGKVWSAKCIENHTIEKHAIVKVVAIEGVKLVVKNKEGEI